MYVHGLVPWLDREAIGFGGFFVHSLLGVAALWPDGCRGLR